MLVFYAVVHAFYTLISADKRIYKQSTYNVIQLTLTLKMTTAQVVEMSVTVNNNSPTQDYFHPDDQTQPTFLHPLFDNLLSFIPAALIIILSFIRPLYYKGKSIISWPLAATFNFFLSFVL